MTDCPIGFSTGCFYQWPIGDVLGAVLDGGFTTIEICSFPAHLDLHDTRRVEETARTIERNGMVPLSLHAPFAPHIDITSLDGQTREHSVREMLVACDAAAVLGVSHIVLHPGPEREGWHSPAEFLDRLENASRAIDRVALRCRDHGIDLLLENMLPHLVFGSPKSMLYILGAIGSTDVGACLDTGHAYLSGDIRSVVHKLSGHLRMVHVNDNLGDRDAHLPPGSGSIDWLQFLADLERQGFRGALVLELAGRHGADFTVAMDEARRARHYLLDICRNLGRASAPPTSPP